jgi:hypothetical protein
MCASKTAFTDIDLAQLEWVYEEVRAALEEQQGRIEDGTKTIIRRRIFMLACNGVADPDVLRSNVLTSFTRTTII